MKIIQSSIAKAQFAELLGQAERGETIVITRHGKPIARIVPDPEERQRKSREAVEAIKELRKHTGHASVEELLAWRDEGRK